MKDIKYFEKKCERYKKWINMLQCQLSQARSMLEWIEENCDEESSKMATKSLDAVEAIYVLHNGDKLVDNPFFDSYTSHRMNNAK